MERFRPRECLDDRFVDAARALILRDTYGWPAAHRADPTGNYYAPKLGHESLVSQLQFT